MQWTQVVGAGTVEIGVPKISRREISALRLMGSSIVLVTVLSAIVVGVRHLPTTITGAWVGAALGAVALVIAASPIEWAVHRYVYHRRVLPGASRIYDIHEKGHHRTFFPTWRYVTNGPVRRHAIVSSSYRVLHSAFMRNLVIKMLHAGFYLALAGVLIWLPAWLMTGRLSFLFGLMTATLVVADLVVRVHDAMHYPEHNRFIRSQPWFKFLAAHHYIHHVDTNANVNFLLPLADFLFGTMRRTLTSEELARHGSMEEATAVPIGASEPAREVAQPRALTPVVQS